MPRLVITPAAEQDVAAIWRYIAADNIPAADTVHEKIAETLESIAQVPRIGTSYQTTRPRLLGLRAMPVRDYPTYIVYYIPTDHCVIIIRILHGHRDRQKLL